MWLDVTISVHYYLLIKNIDSRMLDVIGGLIGSDKTHLACV